MPSALDWYILDIQPCGLSDFQILIPFSVRQLLLDYLEFIMKAHMLNDKQINTNTHTRAHFHSFCSFREPQNNIINR